MTYQKRSKFCVDDISLIENYKKAIEDKSTLYVLHHRLEITENGILSKEDLIKRNLYYNRPASELIWLPIGEHAKLHNSNRSKESKMKFSNTFKENTKLGKYKH